MEVVISICVGISLSASAGLRAFMPLFMAGFLARWDWIPLGESFEWLSEPPALIALGVAMCCEMAAYHGGTPVARRGSAPFCRNYSTGEQEPGQATV